MQTLVFSDTHLTNHFDQSKYDFLVKIIKDSDRVVINGDFWDHFVCSFDEFIKSRWQELFSLLKEKQAIYIYGNHDLPQFCDQRTSLFSTSAVLDYRFSAGQNNFYLTHGHTVLRNITVMHPALINFPLTRWLIRWYGFVKEGLMILLLGNKYLIRNFHNGNNLLKVWGMGNLKSKEYLVCGHTHRPETTEQFLNSGFIDWGMAQYLLIEGSQVTLKQERY